MSAVCPKTERRIQIYKKRPAIWQDGSFFDHISFNWSIFGDGLFRVRADHTASHSQHRDRKQDCHGVYLLLSDFDATIRQVIVFVNKFFKVFIVKLHKCFVKTNKNRRCVLDTSPVRLYPFRMSVFRYWMASDKCSTPICSAPSRSAMVRATRSTRSWLRAVRPMRSKADFTLSSVGRATDS